jgi:hypothetical protein
MKISAFDWSEADLKETAAVLAQFQATVLLLFADDGQLEITADERARLERIKAAPTGLEEDEEWLFGDLDGRDRALRRPGCDLSTRPPKNGPGSAFALAWMGR